MFALVLHPTVMQQKETNLKGMAKITNQETIETLEGASQRREEGGKTILRDVNVKQRNVKITEKIRAEEEMIHPRREKTQIDKEAIASVPEILLRASPSTV